MLGDFRSMRFVLFFALSLVFAMLYLLFCDDTVDFGGINVLHDSIRNYLGQDIAASALVQDQIKRSIQKSQGTALKEPFDRLDYPRVSHIHAEDDSDDINSTNTSAAIDVAARDAPNVRHKIVRDATQRAAHTKFSLKRMIDMAYFSLSNTVTMGYGDIYPISMRAKVLVILQILCTFAVLCVL